MGQIMIRVGKDACPHMTVMCGAFSRRVAAHASRATRVTQRYARDAEIRAAHDDGDTARYACNVEIPYRCDTVPHRDTHATKRYTGNAEIHARRIDTRTTQR